MFSSSMHDLQFIRCFQSACSETGFTLHNCANPMMFSCFNPKWINRVSSVFLDFLFSCQLRLYFGNSIQYCYSSVDSLEMFSFKPSSKFTNVNLRFQVHKNPLIFFFSVKLSLSCLSSDQFRVKFDDCTLSVSPFSIVTNAGLQLIDDDSLYIPL